ncbi:hypothetical protein V2I71_21725 [Peribacillus frigoritolerans]|uniref:dual OB domain-containing protein n=1 Tax=Peribacillus frigoritolerans TaxID=450367 RepID=UPI002ED48F72|nr:hypothetical protein V2I71_21725 [Peribacillus frigoritolerans]
MKVYILAVTDAAYGDYCIAGMTEEGEWIRPIPNDAGNRFWTVNQLTIDKEHGFLRVGDVIEINGKKPIKFQHENHIEDFSVSGNMTFLERLSNTELLRFLKGKEETQQTFNNTVNAAGRSICMVKVDGFQHEITKFQGEAAKPKMIFSKEAFSVTNPKTIPGNYIVKDCKWSRLVLNQSVSNSIAYDEIYLVIGLATKWGDNNTEYPQVIGLHTEPEVLSLSTYPK